MSKLDNVQVENFLWAGDGGDVDNFYPHYPGMDAWRQIQGQTNISSLPRLITIPSKQPLEP